MTRFRCVPMDPAAAARFRITGTDDRGGAVHHRAVDGPGFPCRACLRLGLPGEAMLLASWDLPLPRGPYWTPSPVFLHARDCASAPVEDSIPETVRANPLVSLRHYDADGMCLYDLGVVLPGEAAEAALRERIADPRVAFVNIHTARPGCWLTRVEKA
ncbi:DUF1203 domain-containing protein [Roseomonas alkaliterrae]|uniref:DUF1203 domain-containing protein n=1 Tax=Neoroseomonas alkaliterrae TaxID=1452450 RepID=A0A840Y3W3_9PROT|nr:DUF1203 domain-containing protein [Neoroseomonas alkaliterrae]MBB5690681.1 hypothetical protein [Neoroseomonas alkaliterrae]MBR0678293.1 DUF1203 domain-containing protein [Neoroseomonas alkaliterrae]